ncbi:hypothetical protein [Mesonia mobilis]|uniref:Membrane or secreted protein n=1 Tax=Mesonia mobilis TaxID=369791 RepID=A0ABQ3BH33_9FLAO|nr:hypothetical protein [Mesonia mobilis]MBQ0738204.1 hypothetical protein [Aquimarina celericrescens]GGZ45020.1 hypothetical protein GCM10008088_02750 [Mesonia mobilis]
MKKFLVLGVLFILPIVAYLFFSSGVNNFAKLPVLTPQISNLEDFTSLDGNKVVLDNKITILSIYGSNIEAKEGNAFNLNEKIYDKNYNFEDFQFVVIAENGTQDQARVLLKELSTTIDTRKWKFVFGSSTAIQSFFNSLKTDLDLDEYLGTPKVFIIDKDRSLRGRPKEEGEEAVYGYNTSSVADLTNTMTDDVKVILAEYRLALKKYNRKEALK